LAVGRAGYQTTEYGSIPWGQREKPGQPSKKISVHPRCDRAFS
jgi:hypothetical protein